MDWSPITKEVDMSDTQSDKPSQAEGDVGDDGPSNLHAQGEGDSQSQDTEQGSGQDEDRAEVQDLP
ncbi:MAG: hypothetical protein K0R60_1212 [Microbacterium sp.]|jgi:hypothetical protein|nr:hypothetical protein [Microbacterium sp.]